MTPTKYVHPRLGRFSLSLLMLLLVGTAALFTDYCLRVANETTPGSTTYTFLMVGLIYGWTAAGSWMLSFVERRYLRWGLQVGLIAFFSNGLNLMTEGELIRFFSSLGGLVFVQTAAFHLLGMPRWQTSSFHDEESFQSNGRQARQFGIGEIVAATTCIALLLAIAIRYDRDEVDSVSYWLTLLAFWCVNPLNAASMIVAVLGRRRPAACVGWVLLSLALTATCVAGFSVAQLGLTDLTFDASFGPGYWQFVVLFVVAYASILFTNLSVFAVMASVGRWQASRKAQSITEDSAEIDQAFGAVTE